MATQCFDSWFYNLRFDLCMLIYHRQYYIRAHIHLITANWCSLVKRDILTSLSQFPDEPWTIEMRAKQETGPNLVNVVIKTFLLFISTFVLRKLWKQPFITLLLNKHKLKTCLIKSLYHVKAIRKNNCFKNPWPWLTSAYSWRWCFILVHFIHHI